MGRDPRRKRMEESMINMRNTKIDDCCHEISKSVLFILRFLEIDFKSHGRYSALIDNKGVDYGDSDLDDDAE